MNRNKVDWVLSQYRLFSSLVMSFWISLFFLSHWSLFPNSSSLFCLVVFGSFCPVPMSKNLFNPVIFRKYIWPLKFFGVYMGPVLYTSFLDSWRIENGDRLEIRVTFPLFLLIPFRYVFVRREKKIKEREKRKPKSVSSFTVLWSTCIDVLVSEVYCV